MPLFFMKKYLITALSAFIIEIASAFHITFTSEKSVWMLLMAAIGPFLGLPFAGFMVETKIWKERIILACSLSFGYFLGAVAVYILFHWPTLNPFVFNCFTFN